MKSNYDYLFKIHLLGEPNVGKSSLLLRYVDDEFSTSYIATLGADFKIKDENIDGKTIKLQIYDNAPQGRIGVIEEHKEFRGVKAVIIAFDLTDKTSFNALPKWLAHANKVDQPIVILVGTKADLKEQRQVSEEEITTFMQTFTHKIHAYHATSAKENLNISKAIVGVVQALLQKHAPIDNDNHETTNSSEKNGFSSFFSQFFSCGFANKNQQIVEKNFGSDFKK